MINTNTMQPTLLPLQMSTNEHNNKLTITPHKRCSTDQFSHLPTTGDNLPETTSTNNNGTPSFAPSPTTKHSCEHHTSSLKISTDEDENTAKYHATPESPSLPTIKRKRRTFVPPYKKPAPLEGPSQLKHTMTTRTLSTQTPTTYETYAPATDNMHTTTHQKKIKAKYPLTYDVRISEQWRVHPWYKTRSPTSHLPTLHTSTFASPQEKHLKLKKVPLLPTPSYNPPRKSPLLRTPTFYEPTITKATSTHQ